MKTQVTLQEVVNLLRALNRRDPEAVHALIETRVPCNQLLADHPTVQVMEQFAEGQPQYVVGLLGVLNGLFGMDENGMGAIIANIAPYPPGVVSFHINPNFERKAS